MCFNNHDYTIKYFSMTKEIQDKYQMYLLKKNILIRGGIVLKCDEIFDRHKIKPITVLCSKGHEFITLPYVVNLNKWCPECAKLNKKTTKANWDRKIRTKQI